jgi:hypothetical protein
MTKKLYLLLLFAVLSCASYSQANIEAGDNDTVCKTGATVTVPLTGTVTTPNEFLYYRWRPSALVADSTSLVTTATVSETTTFSLSGYTPYVSFLPNGNFSNGNTGFTSSYGYVVSPAPVLNEGYYSIVSQGHDVHYGFTYAYDHTCNCPTGKYMIVNGNQNTGITVWQASVPVVPNTDYVFYCWVMTANCTTQGVTVPESQLARLQFKIN